MINKRTAHQKGLCCLCGRPFESDLDDHNPWPVSRDADARCCSDCNMTKVIPARLAMIRTASKKEQ
jgi:hypothetical protein